MIANVKSLVRLFPGPIGPVSLTFAALFAGAVAISQRQLLALVSQCNRERSSIWDARKAFGGVYNKWLSKCLCKDRGDVSVDSGRTACFRRGSNIHEAKP